MHGGEDLAAVYHEKEPERPATASRHLVDGFIGLVAGTVGGWRRGTWFDIDWHLFAGATASVYTGQPLDTVKVKMQAFPQLYRSSARCLLDTFRKDGVRAGLYAGTVPALAANVAENAVLFASLDFCRQLVARAGGRGGGAEQLGPLGSACAGSLAAVCSTVALTPTELVKCRLQAARELAAERPSACFRPLCAALRTRRAIPVLTGCSPGARGRCVGRSCAATGCPASSGASGRRSRARCPATSSSSAATSWAGTCSRPAARPRTTLVCSRSCRWWWEPGLGSCLENRAQWGRGGRQPVAGHLPGRRDQVARADQRQWRLDIDGAGDSAQRGYGSPAEVGPNVARSVERGACTVQWSGPDHRPNVLRHGGPLPGLREHEKTAQERDGPIARRFFECRPWSSSQCSIFHISLFHSFIFYGLKIVRLVLITYCMIKPVAVYQFLSVIKLMFVEFL